MSPLPPRLADRIGYTLVRLALGDMKRYGLPRPAWLPFSARHIPIIDVGFVKEVKSGRVVVRPNVARFTPTGVVCADGRAEAFDTVVAANGFTTGLDGLLDLPGLLDAQGPS